MTLGKENEDELFEKGKHAENKKESSASRPSPGVADYITGEAKAYIRNLKPFLPQEIIGGVIPHVPGTEEEAVWNAAAQACGTEKINFCYSVNEGRVWYLACPSSVLASNPDSWCPLAAALPGNSEYWDQETVYLYEQEGLAAALRWDPETGRMQVFLGASRTILPRVQSMDANFVTIKPEMADIVPWRNRNLKTEKLSRATVMGLLYTALVICFTCFAIVAFSFFSINTMKRDLVRVKQETERASTDLMLKAADIMKSETIKHLVGVQDILDHLARVDGTLVRYEIKKGKLEWEALIPQAFAKEFPKAKVLELEADGRVRIKSNAL